MQQYKESVRSEVIGQFCPRRTICYVGASKYVKSTDDGRRLAVQLFSHHGILLRGPVFSIFLVLRTVAEISGEFLVRPSGLFFHGGGNVTVDEVGCR